METVDRKVKIYALINSLDGKVFYIGATVQPLRQRLHCHAQMCFHKERAAYYREQGAKGAKMGIIELDECNYKEGSFWEQFYMDLFRSFGYNLLQSRKSNYNERKPLVRRRGRYTWS